MEITARNHMFDSLWRDLCDQQRTRDAKCREDSQWAITQKLTDGIWNARGQQPIQGQHPAEVFINVRQFTYD